RRQGPQGGDLFPVGKTGMLAEALEDSGKPGLTIWQPSVRNGLKTWEQMPVERISWRGERHAQVWLNGKAHDVVLISKAQQQMDLRTTADWVIRPRLLQVPGVAEVFVLGGDRKQYQALVDPNALLEYDVSLQQVEQAVKDNNLNGGGGF